MSKSQTIVERRIYPEKSSSPTNSSKFATIPLEQAVEWEHQLDGELRTINIKFVDDGSLRVSPVPFIHGFFVLRHISRTAKYARQFRFPLPVDWLQYHEYCKHEILKLRMELGVILKITPVLRKECSVLSSLKETKYLATKVTSHIRRFMLSEEMLRSLITRNDGQPVRCRKCGKKLRAGQEIVSIQKRRTTPNTLHSDYYHDECYESCFYEGDNPK